MSVFKNFGTTAVKFQYTINLKQLVLPDMYDNFDGSETLCIAFERGKNKDLSYTEEKRISLNDNDEIVADFTKESFLAEVTLHRDNKTGFYREKTGTLSLMQRKYASSGSTREAFKTLGMANIPFHLYTDGKEHEKELFFGGALPTESKITVVIAGVSKDKTEGVNSHDDGDNESVASSSVQRSLFTSSAPATAAAGSKTMVPFLGTNKVKSSGASDTSDHINVLSKMSFNSGDDRKFEQTFAYQNMKRRIEELEDTVLSSAELMEFEKTKTKELTAKVTYLEADNENLKQSNGSMSFQIEHLNTDLEILQKENESLKATISKYTLEGGKLQSLLTKATDDIAMLSETKIKLEKALKDKNDECEDLLAELIKTKVSVGELSGELDETKKALRELKGNTAQKRRTTQTNGTPVMQPPDLPPPRRSITQPQTNERPQQPQLPPSRQSQLQQQQQQQQQYYQQQQNQPPPYIPPSSSSSSSTASRPSVTGGVAYNPYTPAMNGNNMNNNNAQYTQRSMATNDHLTNNNGSTPYATPNSVAGGGGRDRAGNNGNYFPEYPQYNQGPPNQAPPPVPQQQQAPSTGGSMMRGFGSTNSMTNSLKRGFGGW